MQTYAVYWSDAEGRRSAGCLSLGLSSLELHDSTYRRIDFDEIESVRYERGRLHLSPRRGSPLSIGSVDKPGALSELYARLAEIVVERRHGDVPRTTAPSWA
jgi:hypothetical protein